ncbi:sugar fermentation stimulation protein [Sulfurihydrogenibium azorense Az-Fu1]|uniref:Sugar fermentation stimulation protein n=1 Tax=Sulfurihydrogenibium azorense (strain DSM 15241 / OCM 825 / Az-Fu1) TaxID=204536 RepID=C1DV76_SULAA|nr:DNA/RNA nuclease SfsA [Sulfurihydrogenibium azorense]ACN99261.1 sugar fermentation stimulation protein [Sulfurihydrogenibium azorense Az-Fu1]
MIILNSSEIGKPVSGTFLYRKNRFVGVCLLDGKEVSFHISDTGRLKEILTQGREILLLKSKQHNKLPYKLLAAKMEEGFVLINTSLHSKIGKKIIQMGLLGFKPSKIKSEIVYKDSRLDFLVDDKLYIELKGCNLLVDNRCLFPDAPTTRGLKHLKHLIEIKKEGFEAAIMILSLRECDTFLPNYNTDPNFSKIFETALKEGVKFYGFKVKFDNNFNIVYNGELEVDKQLWK